jgi:arabinose-5-phosphate isomerase
VDDLAFPPSEPLGLTPRIWAVGALCRAIADALEARFNPVAVRGEISGFTRASSGHCYFTLKDSSGQLRCAMFKRAAQMLDFRPVDGELVEIRGRLGVYEPRGELQLVVEHMRRAGQGAWFEQFLQLKAKLEAEGLFHLAASLDDNFSAASDLILNTCRQLVVTGLGKSGHIARKIAATFAATGTPAIFVHPSEAGHGDMGMIAQGDVLLVLSNSGNTPELQPVMKYARKLGVPIIGMASGRTSKVIQGADIALLLPNVREACPENIAPTTSTTMQLALGDALAMTVMEMRGVTRKDLRKLHPAGAIGLALTPVQEVMATDQDRLPLVSHQADMPKTISVMTSGCFGLAGVLDDAGRIIGVITDGDLRRHFGTLETALAHEVMTRAARFISADMLADEALTFLNDNKINAAFVVEDPSAGPQLPLGVIHIHDLLRLGLG